MKIIYTFSKFICCLIIMFSIYKTGFANYFPSLSKLNNCADEDHVNGHYFNNSAFSNIPTEYEVVTTVCVVGCFDVAQDFNIPSNILTNTVSSITDICVSDNVLLFLTGDLYTDVEYQWQSSPCGLNIWTNITNATSSTLSVIDLSMSTDYRAIILCDGMPISASPSIPISISVANPEILTTTPQTQCGPGPLTFTLEATATPGAIINWYDVPSGGTSLSTGSPFVTPALNTTTTYYVDASDGGILGLPAALPTALSGSGTTNFGMVFDVLAPCQLQSVVVYPIALTAGTPGTVTIDVINSANVVLHTQTVNVTGNPVASAVGEVVTLNFNLLPGTNLKLRPRSRSSSIIGLLFEPSTSSPPGGNYGYPFSIPGILTINHSTLTAAPANTARLNLYYYFYNWVVNTGSTSARVPVIATLVDPPVCPNDQIVCINEPAFTLTGATPIDGVYSGPGVSNGIFNATLAGIGSHLISYEYCSSTCNFYINVQDVMAPVAICQPATIQLNSSGTASITLAEVNNGSSDNCGITSLSLSQSAFTCANLGANSVTLTVTDINGNTATCTSTITVQDNIVPTSICQNITIQINNIGSGSTTAAAVNNGSSDNCGIASLSLSKTTFTCANVGANTVVLTVTDVNSNTATCTSTVTVQDMVAPIAVCQNRTIQLNGSGTGTTTATLVNNGSSDACGIASLSLNNTSFTCANVGANTVVLTVTDVNGNTANCTSTITVQDMVAPIAVCQNRTVQLTGSGFGFISAFEINNGSSDACGIASLSLNNTSFTCANIGANSVVLTVTDVNGNTATCTSTVTVQDMVAPTAVCQNITLELNSAGFGSLFFHQVNNGSSDNCGVANYSLSQSFFTCTNIGANTITLTVTDVNSNSSSCSSIVNIIDNHLPAITCPNNIMMSNDIKSCSAVVSFSNPIGTDNCSGATTTQTGGLSSGSTFPVGVTTNIFRVTDANNNTATCSFTITVNDSQLPLISCQSNINVNNNSNNCSAIVSFPLPYSIDNCSGQTITQTAGLTSGQAFPVGVTTNTFRVTDASGNTATCSFSVIVTDNQLPTITCPSNINISNDINECSAIVMYTTPVGADNCSGQTTIQTAGLASGVAFPVGVTTNTFRVTDASNNTATCSFTVTVTDVTAPVAVCKDITVMLDINQSYTLTASEINDNSSDNCGTANLSIESGTISYTCMHVPGVYSIVLKVTDAQIATSTCTSNITVIQNTTNTCCSGPLTLVGPSTMCPGGTAFFTMTPINVPDGVWTSDNSPVISVDEISGVITNNGDVNTTAIITYTVTQQGCNEELTSKTINVITPNLIQAGNINDAANWELGCMPTMIIPNGTTIIIDFDLMVPQGVNMDYHGDLIIQALKSVTNNGTLNSHGGKIINNGIYKGSGIFMGNFMNSGSIKPGN